MRSLPQLWSVTGAAAVVAGCLCGAAAADQPSLLGTWKLSLPSQGEVALLILEIKQDDGALAGTILEAHEAAADLKVAAVHRDDNALRIEFTNKSMKDHFSGTIPKELGNEPIKGTFTLAGRYFPAELRPTPDGKLPAELDDNSAGLKIQHALRGVIGSEKEIETLRHLLEEYAGNPSLQKVFLLILRPRESENLSTEEVRHIVAAWLDNARPYGPNWVANTQSIILRSLGRNPALKDLRFEVAQAAAASLTPDIDADLRASVLRSVVGAADAAGKADEVADSVAELARLETFLDDEYIENVPPFTVKVFGGRSDAAQNRVVLLELFTGAECPPCVAVDVAFDALIETYKPSEMIGLQYHLHVPGPDPLSNVDALERSRYYGVKGTPSTYINGQAETEGGGSMAQSEEMYDQFVAAINTALQGRRGATIDLRVKRDGDAVAIEATAAIDPPVSAKTADDAPAVQIDPAAEKAAAQKAALPAAAKAEGEKPAADAEEKIASEENGAPTGPQYRLRLALIEETVRYTGGNKLRFHHHVVRAMPGGAGGKVLSDAGESLQATVDLAQLRTSLDDYLQEFAASREFPWPLPPIENKELSVVAFVQDDADKSILDAVLVPVPHEP